MDRNLVLNIHLVEFINAADSMISKHKSTCLDAELSSLKVLPHRRGKTSSVGCFTAAVDGTR